MVFQFFKAGVTKLASALSKAHHFLGEKLSTLFRGNIDEEVLEKLEELFYSADFGVQTAAELAEEVRKLHLKHPGREPDFYLSALRTKLLELFSKHSSSIASVESQETPLVLLIVGVNGNGKTTSVAKLAHLFGQSGKKVLVGACDTFRAAAMHQLEVWAQRLNIDIVKGSAKSDPAAVAFDAIQAAKARSCDVVLIDTAGRLHTKTPLMQELEKIKRVCQKASKSAPHEILLVLDATTGQNAIDQAKQFHKYTPLTGIILTKLDGTAKGGIAVAIQRELGIPIKFIGTGELLDDLQPFDPEQFVKQLL